MAKQATPARGKAPPTPAKKPAPAPARAPQKPAPAPARAPVQSAQRPTAPKQNGTAVVRAQAALPANAEAAFEQAMQESTGVGTSSEAADNLIPIVRILQKLSPAVEPNSADYIEGAQAGMFLLRGINELVGGDEGFVFQPCGFEKWVSEWIPRDNGGGLVNRWKMEKGETVEQVLDRVGRVFEYHKRNPKAKRESIMTAEGNEIMESREIPGRIIMEDGRRMQFIVSMTGSNHAVARGWMVTLRGKRNAQGRELDSYLSLFRLSLKYAENEQGNWYKYDVEDLGNLKQCLEKGIITDLSMELSEGRALADAFLTGAKQADTGDLTSEEYTAGAVAGTGGGGAGKDGEEIPF